MSEMPKLKIRNLDQSTSTQEAPKVPIAPIQVAPQSLSIASPTAKELPKAPVAPIQVAPQSLSIASPTATELPKVPGAPIQITPQSSPVSEGTPAQSPSTAPPQPTPQSFQLSNSAPTDRPSLDLPDKVQSADIPPTLEVPRTKSKLSLRKPRNQQEALTTPANNTASIEESVEFIACPSCEEALSTQALLCTNCGYNVEVGKKRRTVIKKAVVSKNDTLKEIFGMIAIIFGWLAILPIIKYAFLMIAGIALAPDLGSKTFVILLGSLAIGAQFYLFRSYINGGNWLKDESNTPLQLWAILLRIFAWFCGWLSFLGLILIIVGTLAFFSQIKGIERDDSSLGILIGTALGFATCFALHIVLKSISQKHLYHPDA